MRLAVHAEGQPAGDHQSSGSLVVGERASVPATAGGGRARPDHLDLWPGECGEPPAGKECGRDVGEILEGGREVRVAAGNQVMGRVCGQPVGDRRDLPGTWGSR